MDNKKGKVSDFIAGIENQIDKQFEKFVDDICEPKIVPCLSFENCLTFATKVREQKPEVAAFILSMETKKDENKEDFLIVTQGLLDSNLKAVSHEEYNSLSRVVHARTIDIKMIDYLNGEKSKIFKF